MRIFPAFQVDDCLFMRGSHSTDDIHPFFNGWKTPELPRMAALETSPTWTSSQAWAAVGSCVQHSSQVESDRLSRAGGLYEVALKGLRRATNYEHLSFNPYSVMDKQSLCMWSHPQSTLNTYTLSHFHVSICSTHTQKFKLYTIHTYINIHHLLKLFLLCLN